MGSDPDLVINCAAYTAVDAAESDEATARAGQRDLSVGEMAAWTADHGCPARDLLDGLRLRRNGERAPILESSAQPSPMSAYGRTKLEGERLAAGRFAPNALIVRTSWVISGTHPNFVSTMLGWSGSELRGRG